MACVISRLGARCFSLYLLLSSPQMLLVAASCLCCHPCLTLALRKGSIIWKKHLSAGCIFGHRNEHTGQTDTEKRSEVFVKWGDRTGTAPPRETRTKLSDPLLGKPCVTVPGAFRRRSEERGRARVCPYARGGLATRKTRAPQGGGSSGAPVSPHRHRHRHRDPAAAAPRRGWLWPPGGAVAPGRARRGPPRARGRRDAAPGQRRRRRRAGGEGAGPGRLRPLSRPGSEHTGLSCKREVRGRGRETGEESPDTVPPRSPPRLRAPRCNGGGGLGLKGRNLLGAHGPDPT